MGRAQGGGPPAGAQFPCPLLLQHRQRRHRYTGAWSPGHRAEDRTHWRSHFSGRVLASLYVVKPAFDAHAHARRLLVRSMHSPGRQRDRHQWAQCRNGCSQRYCLASHTRLTKVFFAHMSTKPELRRELGLRELTLFAITCVISARWIPIAAHAGPGSVTLWLLAAVLFMVPLAVAVGALVAKYPGAGGLYLWTRQDFGAWPAFLCFWVYWMGIAFLFPTAALLYVKVGFSMFGPSFARLGDNRFYLLSATVALIWIALGSNLIGLKIGKWTENIGALATWAVGLLLVAVAWSVRMHRGSAQPTNIIPKWSWGTVNFWAAIAYATSGMEGPGMMAAEIREPERTMLRAGWIASGVATAFYVSATIAFLVVLSPENISELNGFADIGNSAGLLLRARWLSPLLALLVLASGVGFVGGLGTATSRLPFAAGVDRLLPRAFGRVHPRWGTPYVSILALGLGSDRES